MTAKKSTAKKTAAKAAKRPPKQVTSKAAWKQQVEEDPGVPVEVPSGNVALLRKPAGLNHFIQAGEVPNPLLPIAQRALKGEVSTQPVESEDAAKLMDDPEALLQTVDFMDKVVYYMVIEPELTLPPTDPREPRDPDALYVDKVAVEDRAFIMAYAMTGVTDLETFREQLGATVESLPVGQDVVLQAIRALGD